MNARSLTTTLALLLSGCNAGGDFARHGTWQPTGVNDANLTLMLAHPGHAVRGVGAATDPGQPASLAVRRLEQDRRRPLPDSRASTVGAAAAMPPGTGPEPTNGR